MRAMEWECVGITWNIIGGHNSPYTFLFQNPGRAYFFKSSRKNMVHIFVSQWKLQAVDFWKFTDFSLRYATLPEGNPL